MPGAEHRTRPELALELIRPAAGWFPNDQLVVTGDSAYGGASVLKHFPANVHLISRVHSKAALYRPAPPRAKGAKGRPRKKGGRLPTLSQWASDSNQPWEELAFDQFGLHATLKAKTIEALYYRSGGDWLLTIVLVRDAEGCRPDQMFYRTDLNITTRDILSAYACRWSIEYTFENCKQFLGLEDQANRTPRAVERTAPIAGLIYSLTVAWFQDKRRATSASDSPSDRGARGSASLDSLTSCPP